MSALDRIIEELKANNKTQTELCEHLGIRRQAFSDWKSERSLSYYKLLPQIAEFLDVSVDYLLGRSDFKRKPKFEELSEEERILLFRFRILRPKEQQRILGEVRVLRKQLEERLAKENQENKKK